MVKIRPIQSNDREALIQLTLTAFEPIFNSFRAHMGDPVFDAVYPSWQNTQIGEINYAYQTEQVHSYVAEQNGNVAGLIVYKLDHKYKWGEIHFLVVDPTYQNAGIGMRLNEFAVQQMREAGMQRAEVGTGGDDAHAAARRTYEKSGFRPLPLVRYYKYLGEPS